MILSWVQFFLNGVIETATNSINTFKSIIKLRENIEFEILPKLGRSRGNAKKLIYELYKNPIADGASVCALC
jgi:hypothetical protein